MSKTNKLGIYLIKKEYVEHADILKDYNTPLQCESVEGIGQFYYGESHTFKPDWLQDFFISKLINGSKSIYSASAKGLLLISINKNDEQRIFAIAFGYGWQFLKPGVYEERFGLKTALSIIDPENLRKIGKKNMVTVPKDTNEQLSKSGVTADFGIDIEQDLLCSVTGKSINENVFGKTVTGKDTLSLSVKININSIKEFLGTCYDRYLSNDYKKDFDWIDQFAEIKDVKLLDILNHRLIENLKSNNLSDTWMAIPDIVEWEKVKGFKYSQRKDEDSQNDIEISFFLSSLTDKRRNELCVDLLKRKTIYCISASNEESIDEWSAYNCLYCEVHIEDKTYLLSNGKWYEIATDFSKRVNNDYETLRDKGCSLSLPSFNNSNHKNEADYNKSIPSFVSSIGCMDTKTVTYGGGHSKIEFCDLISRDNKFIHVKYYGGSSVLSHLFFQGLNSGELFLRDSEFREKVNEKLPDGFKFSNTTINPAAKDYEIIYAIISTKPEKLKIPFFSKVSLRNARLRLETYGYKVSLLKIPTN